MRRPFVIWNNSYIFREEKATEKNHLCTLVNYEVMYLFYIDKKNHIKEQTYYIIRTLNIYLYRM